MRRNCRRLGDGDYMRRKKYNADELRAKKLELFDCLASGKLTIGQATKEMRKMTGLTQPEYAQKVLGIYPRVLMDIEKDKGNPTLDTLNKIAKPFGLRVVFAKEPDRQPRQADENV